ncbi:alanine racemase [Parvularcula dongshanensis]|uniref:Alanine racemase n=1 Tax=Parvularcula dongshanensis TaxID=1173995 RepID=A0A840I4R7_9PROT|nr:alanine racemase [Parvularcula dongshanensis]
MPLPPNRPALTVDLAALGRNLEALRARAGGAEVATVVKADAYGLGAPDVARHLAERCGVRTMFVAYAYGAERVRGAINKPGIDPVDLYVLNGYNPADDARYDMAELRPVLNTAEEAVAWARREEPCAIGVDVGMNRLGIPPEDLLGFCKRTGLDKDDVRLVLMHLSHAGTPAAAQNRAQTLLFEDTVAECLQAFPRAKFSLSASGGLFLPNSPAEGLVRAGIALYGGAPDADPASALEPVATLTAPVLTVRTVARGDTAGYDGIWRAPHESRLATLAIGYADGYPRHLSNKGVVWLGGRECPVAGKVSMDLLIVDVTEAEDVKVGDRAELFGPHVPVDRLARLAGTISYELLTSIGARVERRYVR